jgi:hypothetical protein
MRASITILGVWAMTTIGGCANPVEEIDESVDCADICDRYRDCYDDSYDTGACRNRCNGLVDGENGDPHAADACDACLDERSCVESAFTCGGACAGILP